MWRRVVLSACAHGTLFACCALCSLETAKQLGATHTFLARRDGDPKQLAADIAQVVKNQGGLDFAVDTTGRR